MDNLEIYQYETVTLNFDTQSPTQATLTLEKRQCQTKYLEIDLGDNLKLEMVYVPEGSFIMGTPDDEEGRSHDENPQHEVNVTSFLMSKYPITQAQYLAIMKTNPSMFQGEKKPVECVSYYDCLEFCQKLSELSGLNLRLPSEAEWEYACRAGTTTPFYYGETITTDLANYRGEFAYGKGPKGMYRKETTDVGSFPPNAFGLYDLHGNVWEWCADTWHETYDNAPTESIAWVDQTTGDEFQPRVLRGGSWDDTAYYCRSGVRLWTSPHVQGKLIGFRVVC